VAPLFIVVLLPLAIVTPLVIAIALALLHSAALTTVPPSRPPITAVAAVVARAHPAARLPVIVSPTFIVAPSHLAAAAAPTAATLITPLAAASTVLLSRIKPVVAPAHSCVRRTGSSQCR
jgi:hypothetical protein